MADSALDEAYARLTNTGPERDGWLSNHAPMAVEVLAARGLAARVHGWIDGYADRLSERPRGIAPIRPAEWRDPLGDPVRTGDWLDFFARETAAAPWREVLVAWWPRLLPGIAAGATHGVIRVGHAVRALRGAETPERVAELGQGLAYWAARWQPLAPAGAGPYRASDPRSALDAVPLVRDQRYGIRSRLAQLAAMPSWAVTAGAIPTVPVGAGSGDAPTSSPPAAAVAAIADAAVARHATHGHRDPVMLVHAATAPTAVLRVLPELPAGLHRASLAAAWAATAAVTAAYAAPTPRPAPAGPVERDEVLDRALATGDPHAIKFADAAVDAYARTGDARHLTASAVATADIG
ncbi:questin oxidase family protein [Catenuloplanes atrovinosus]|uniref:DUF4243 domain-containing protein n=1 Tax=Catenuloplanes atrovinosus TaxID=137266 RepID=A0AAE3YM91_9ACTN|nr:questin oxidase family protein [Catenuloplanes atrovinosus]MDR7275035.1 hypothetical protein [Catenuloplanes atrovinosus]